jgi:hypothetical protein
MVHGHSQVGYRIALEVNAPTVVPWRSSNTPTGLLQIQLTELWEGASLAGASGPTDWSGGQAGTLEHGARS